MLPVRLTVKNYRAFSDNEPLRIEFGSGFTALVGKNNSGKSSLLLMIYELRNLWDEISNISHIRQAMSQEFYQINTSYLNVPDPFDIFSNMNDRNIEIRVEILSIGNRNSNTNYVKEIILESERNKPSSWRFSGFLDNGVSVSNLGDSKVEISDKEAYLTGKFGKIDFSGMYSVFSSFKGALYVPPFRNAINQGAGNYYDLSVGQSFIELWAQWKTGDSKFQNLEVQKITNEIREIFEFKSLEIDASFDRKNLRMVVNGRPFRSSELGAGLSQFIIVLGNAAVRRPPLILIDEPELNLHPSLQIDFLTSLASYAANDIVFATHSIGLARATAERIYTFDRRDDITTVKDFDATRNIAQFIGELSYSSFYNLGFHRILLVEGPKDLKTIQQFLRKIKKDHETVLLPLHGDQMASDDTDHQLAELKRLSENISAILDSEKTSRDGEPSGKRVKFKEMCSRHGIPVHLTERRAIENYFPDVAVKAAMGDQYGALDPYTSLKDGGNPWSKSDNWRIARQMEFADIEDTDVGRFLNDL